jgi:hypothetical protein
VQKIREITVESGYRKLIIIWCLSVGQLRVAKGHCLTFSVVLLVDIRAVIFMQKMFVFIICVLDAVRISFFHTA